MSGSSAVDAIAEAQWKHRPVPSHAKTEPDRCATCDIPVMRRHQADAVVAAVRAMSPEQLADLTEGRVETAEFVLPDRSLRLASRVVTPWQPVEDQP